MENFENEIKAYKENPDLHWTDVVITTMRCKVTNIADVIKGRLNQRASEYLHKHETSRPVSIVDGDQSSRQQSLMESSLKAKTMDSA